MAVCCLSIREWLRSIHADLEQYVASFEELGYNPEFLMETESEDLENDLKPLVKKVHIRAIVKAHAKLKLQGPATLGPSDAGTPQVTQHRKKPVDIGLLNMIPCAKDVAAFQPDPQSIRSGQLVLIPIWCLRSIQEKVHSEMTFTSGRHKDSSVYELIHDMLSGRQAPEEIEPLKVVLDKAGKLHIVRGHRRGLALCALQGMWRNRTVMAPCILHDAKDSEVAVPLAKNKDTSVNGLAVHLHGKHSKAWHMGKPLFRTSQEWCDSHPDRSVGSSAKPDMNPEPMDNSAVREKNASEISLTSLVEHPPSPVTEPAPHLPLTQAAAQPPPLVMTPPAWMRSAAHSPPPLMNPAAHVPPPMMNPAAHRPPPLMNPGAHPSQMARMQFAWSLACQTVWPNHPAFQPGAHQMHPMRPHQLPQQTPQVPAATVPSQTAKPNQQPAASAPQSSNNLSKMKGGPIGTVNVAQKSSSFEDASIVATHRGATDCRAVLTPTASVLPREEPAERLLQKEQKATLESHIETHETNASASTAQSFSSLSQTGKGFKAGGVELKIGMCICVKVKGSGSAMLSGRILDLRPTQESAPVKVRYSERGQAHKSHEGWLPLERLKVPDYSELKPRMGVGVEGSGKHSSSCAVLQVSMQMDRAQAPVLVRYPSKKGKPGKPNEWVGAERLHCKFLKFHDPVLPSLSDQHVGALETQAKQPVLSVEPVESQDVKEDSPIASAAQPLDELRNTSIAHTTPGVEVRIGMVVCVMGSDSKLTSGEIREVCPRLQSAKVGYGTRGQTGWCKVEWLPLDHLKVPDFSKVKPGTRACVDQLGGGQSFLCTILRVSEEADKARAPVYVHYNGRPDSDEWVGADRLRSKLLMLHAAKLPDDACQQHERLQGGQRGATATVESQEVKEDSPIASAAQPLDELRNTSIAHTTPGVEVRIGMVVCVMGSDSKLTSGEIREVCPRLQSAKVGYGTRGQTGWCKVEWLPLDHLKVPDFSKVKPGTRACVDQLGGGQSFLCTILRVSEEADKARAPVYVHYNGRPDSDEWVGADRLRSKLLMLHAAKLPNDACQQHERLQEGQRGATATVESQEVKEDSPIASAAQPLDELKSTSLASVAEEAKIGMVVCVMGSGSNRMSGQIVDICPGFTRDRALAPLKVRYTEIGYSSREEWLPLDVLKVPDFSKIKPGTQAVALRNGEKWKWRPCTVVEVSQEKERAQEPIYVHWNGRLSKHDSWVGADRFRSKYLPLRELALRGQDVSASLQVPITETDSLLMTGSPQPSEEYHSLTHPPELVNLPDSQALPWQELDSETVAFDHAVHASEKALSHQRREEEWQQELENTLAAIQTEALRCVLEHHNWSGRRFSHPPHLEELLKDLKGFSSLPEEESDMDSNSDSELSVPPSNDMESCCATGASDWEERMARQPMILDSVRHLPGLIVSGTFRSSGGKNGSTRSGEVLVHRGPPILHGCKVKIWGGKTRGPTWDNDRCYVRILDARIWGPRQPDHDGQAVDVQRMELCGRIVHAMEFGVPRQKLFVCVKPKVVHNANRVSFKPINGKLPAIQVPWNTAWQLPSGHDLHVVEVLDWSGDRCPRGQYLRDLKMGSRQSDMSILEAVQTSLNFCDWLLGDPRSELVLTNFAQPERRGSIENTSLSVGIQHPGVPTTMLLSCGQNEIHVHVLDVNAFLDSLGMEQLEILLRKRSVGVWFRDHLDKALDANLPLFPPNIEEQLTFKPGAERPAVTFTIQAAPRRLEVTSVQPTSVRCDCILTAQQAGAMILNDEGGDAGRVLRRINSHVLDFRKAAIARGCGSTLEHWLVALSITGPLLATEQLLQGCMCIVDQYVAATLDSQSWGELLTDLPERSQLVVRYVHGQADPSTRKVFERLLRVKHSDRYKEIQDVMRTLGEILQQPGLTSLQQHACRYSFLRRLHASLPDAYYEIVQESCQAARDRNDWWQPMPRFHVTSPLHRYIDILGMRALKSQLGWTASNPHMLLSRKDLEEAIARTNCRMAAESFGMHIFRTISRMRELSGSGRRVSNAVIGAVGPKYINILVPSETAHTLELKVPVSSLCSPTCVSEYDAATQSVKLTMQNGRDPVQTLRIPAWSAQPMTCVVARNYAQPIPHHASPNSIVVWEIRFHGEKEFVFPTGLKTFPESFSAWPDLTDWPMLDRRVETYSQVWSRIKLCQVHSAVVASDAYTQPSPVSDLRWSRTGGAWRFHCDVDVKLLEYQWLQTGDLAVLSSERGGRYVSLQGIVQQAKVRRQTSGNGTKSFLVEVELSKLAELAWHAQEAFLEGELSWQLQFILVPPNEKKSIQLLQDMQKSALLQGMRLTIPRSPKELKREMEMRPLVTINEAKLALNSACSTTKLNEKQELAVQRGLQRRFSMVQGPPGTGKTSFLVQCVAALLSASRLRNAGEGRILVCAPSNHAADHILDRLVSAGIPPHYVTRIYSRFIERYHGSWYKGGTTKSERSFEIQPHLEEYALHWKVSESPKVKYFPSESQSGFDRCYEEAEVQVLRSSRIVITTCTNAYLHSALVQGEPPHVIRPVSFDTIVIDEAAQASEPDIVLPATSASCRVIVVGDHKQLGPVVTENNLCAPYVTALETPFLERMHQNPRRLSASTMLNLQYRMHPSIRSFPSSQFYQSMLEDVVSIPHRPQLNCVWPQKKDHRRFIDCQTPQSMGLSPEFTRTCDAALMESKVSLKNVGEARSVVAACAALLRQNCSPRDIAVITPYKAQQHEIRARLERDKEIGSRSASILVGTVHALQGSEREYIIVSFVRSTSQDEDVVTSVVKTAGDSVALQEMYGESLGILKNYRMLNVAITRAKYGLICVGNADVLTKGSKDFHDFIHSLRSCKCILSQKEFLESVRARRAGR